MWEISSSPQLGAPQDVLNGQIVDPADVLIGMFWTRIGTPTENAASGTVEEIERLIERGASVFLYFSNQPVMPGTVDTDQLEALRIYRDGMKSRALFREYETPADLKAQVQRDLTREVRRKREDGEATEVSGVPGPGQPAVSASGHLNNDLNHALKLYKAQVRGVIARHEGRWDSSATRFDSDDMRHEMSAISRELALTLGAIAGSP